MKGVSEVIAIILILMITIAIVGLAYTFMSATMSSTTSAASSAVDTTTSSMLTSFTIESIDIAKVYVRNTGQNTLINLSVYVNDEPAIYNVTTSAIAAGQIGTITIYSFIPDGATVKVTSPSGFSTSKIAHPCAQAVGCWKFDEEDREVSPIVIVDDNQASFWEPYTVGTGTVGLPSIENENIDDTSTLKITPSSGSSLYAGIIHDYTAHQNWTTKSLLRFKWYGINSGKTIEFLITNTVESNNYKYQFIDNFTGEKQFSVPFSSFTATGTPTVADINRVAFRWSSNPPASFNLGRTTVDEGVSAEDSSPNGNGGVLVNMVIGTNVSGPTTGMVGNALLFDGVDDYVNLPDVNNLEGFDIGAISFWFKASNKALLYYLSENSSNLNYLSASVGDVSGSYADESFSFYLRRASTYRLVMHVRHGHNFYMDNQWHHAVVVTGNGNNSIYIDGVSQQLTFYAGSSTTNEFSNIDNQNNAYLGRGSSDYFNGTIDEVRIYDRAIY